MADEFSVDAPALRATATELDERARAVASHGEMLDARAAAPVGRGAIGGTVESAVRRAVALVAHDVTGAVRSFYAEAAAAMRRAAAETERQDAEARAAFDELHRASPSDARSLNRSPVARAAATPVHSHGASRASVAGEPPVHSRYADGTPVWTGQQPRRITGPDPAADGVPHTRVQWDDVNGRLYKAREYGQGGVPLRDVDFTIPTFPNGTPRPGHQAPEQHRWIPNDPSNPAAGHKRGPSEPLVMP